MVKCEFVHSLDSITNVLTRTFYMISYMIYFWRNASGWKMLDVL